MSSATYSPWMRRLHWIIALCVGIALLLIELKGWFPRGSATRRAVQWGHIQFGIAVLVLMAPRVLVRLRAATPPITPPSPPWQMVLSKLVHAALLLLTVGIPVLGVSMMFVSGKPWNLLGLALPTMTTPDSTLAHQLKEVHETCGNVLMWLAIAHVAAALYHHFVQRDDTLLRMAPGLRNRSR
ncbi:cytochrome b [Dyella solisilvae]|uniref:Cytochrome b n=1 Tax=Dyella solisilvae TaxID=1920168 RepID=A0A370KD06_9GAMM|nr:cytochrome b [Dyella solisilvae]RDJ00509.1 cytochrome b [Dyella solisilvae]